MPNRVNRAKPGEPSRFVRLMVLTPIAALVAALFVTPLLWMLASAIRPPQDILRYLSPLSVQVLIPADYSGESFRALLGGAVSTGGRQFDRRVWRDRHGWVAGLLDGGIRVKRAEVSVAGRGIRGRRRQFSGAV